MISLLDFQDRGACRNHDPELFFPPSEAGPAAERQVAQAKAVCHLECPVLTECRAYALTYGPDGIWGGMTEAERRDVRRREAALANTSQNSDPDNTEQLGEETQQPESSPVLPSYNSARQSLTRARRALDLAEQAGDADAIARATQRVTAAKQQFDAVRTQTTSGAVA